MFFELRPIFVTCALVAVAAALPLSSDEGVCNNLPPGLDIVASGVDIVNLDLTPVKMNDDRGLKNAVFKFTCFENNTWLDSLNGNRLYQLPDQVSDAFILSYGFMDAQVSYFDGYQHYRTTLVDKFDVDPDFSLGAFTFSSTYQYVQEKQLKPRNFASSVSAFVSTQVYQMKPFSQLAPSPDIVDFVANVIPDNYADNPEVFKQFVDTYGTHYLDQSHLGGTFESTFTYDSAYFNVSVDSADVMKQADNYFYNLAVQHGANPGTHPTNVSQEFMSHSEYHVQYYGGRAELFSNNQFAGWWDSVPASPFLVHSLLKPIWQIIPNTATVGVGKKTVSLESKKQVLRQALIDYSDRNYLKDLLPGLQELLSRNIPRGGPQMAQLHNDINSLLNTKPTELLLHSNVKAVGRNVNNFLLLSGTGMLIDQRLQTLYLSTTIKVKVNGKSSSLELSGNADSPLNNANFTSACGKGTTLQFGVEILPSPAMPDALVGVEMCYQMVNTDNRTVFFTCADNGEFTEPIDICKSPWSDNLYSQWIVKVPENSPVYLQNVKFCVAVLDLNSLDKLKSSSSVCSFFNLWTGPVLIPPSGNDVNAELKWTFSLEKLNIGTPV